MAPKRKPMDNHAIMVDAATKLLIAKRPNVTQSTIKTYESRLQVLVNGLKPSDIKGMLSDVAAVDAFIKKKGSKIATDTTTYTALVRYAEALNLSVAIRKHYDTKMMEFSLKGKEVAKQNIPKEKILKATGGKSTLDLADLQAKVKAMDTFDSKHLLLAMCILMPPRRLEIRSLIYYDKAPSAKDPTDIMPSSAILEERYDPSGLAYNYVYEISPKKFRMVLRNHKERDVQGVFVADLNKEVADVFSQYIEKEGVTHADDVFVKPKADAVYDSSAFSLFVTSALTMLTGIKKLSMDDIRHAWATSVRDGNDASYATREVVSKAMGHSVSTAEIFYNKVATQSVGGGASGSGAGPSGSGSGGSPSDASLLEEVRSMIRRLKEIEIILAKKQK